MQLSVSQVYTSIACNRTPEIVDWNSDGVICYGGSNAVIIYDRNAKGMDSLTVLSHHRARVNSVKWLRKPNGTSTELISCSSDKTAAIWTLSDGVWKVTASLEGHADGVMCIHGTYHGEKLLVFTGSVDSTVKVWERTKGLTSLKHTIPLQSGLCLTLHCHVLPTVNQPILFCALDDHKIHVFCGDDFHRVHQMVGHEDWVRGMDVLDTEDSSVLVASCSQDTYIRLWRIQIHSCAEVLDISVEKKLFEAYGEQWSVRLDAVLGGHEGWVYGVQWHPPVIEGDKKKIVHRLLSSSLDKSLIVWEPEESGAWVERVRLGEVGGSGLGFYGGRFGPGGEILAHGYNGSLHMWTCCKDSNEWRPSVVCGGHFSSVEEVRWEPAFGRYLVSLSADQSTRVHAPWRTPHGTLEWHEVARPQVHGYDMQSLALIDSVTFASAAEEKVIRVFAAPNNFIHNFTNITGEVLHTHEKGCPEGASVPSLGLSNKAIFSGDEGKQDTDDENDGYFVPMNLTEPPTEETLMQNTLWPEQQKLYGHGYEVYALAASPDGALLASACKATSVQHAALILWDTKTWNQIQTLPSHSLTVTQIEFSPDSRRILSVSRDRRWTLFLRREGSDPFELEACTDKSNGVHSRIIWCCAWAPDGRVFATGSREGKVCVWSKTECESGSSLRRYALQGSALELKASVSALAFAPLGVAARVLAAGTDAGTLNIYSYDGTWTLLKEIDHSAAHHLTVKRLAFRPRCEDENRTRVLLASCGSDHLVRIHRIQVSTTSPC